MKSLTAHVKLLLLFTAVLMGCNSPDTETESKSSTKAQTSSKEEVSAKGGELSYAEYKANYETLLDQVIAIVESVKDDDSEELALQDMKKLESKADQLGEAVAQLIQAAKSDPVSKKEMVEFLKGEDSQRIEAKLNKLNGTRRIHHAASELLSRSTYRENNNIDIDSFDGFEELEVEQVESPSDSNPITEMLEEVQLPPN